MDGHPPGQLYSPAQALAVPCALWQPRGCLDTPTHQLDTGGVAVPALGTLLQHVGGSWLQREHHSGGWGDPLCPVQPTPSPCAHRGPVDEPIRLFLAVDDDAVALAALLGCPGRAEAAGRCWHPACPAPRGAPSRPLPGAQRCPHSPELLPRLHHHEVPGVVDPLVQEVVVVLGKRQVGTELSPCLAPGPAAAPARGKPVLFAPGRAETPPNHHRGEGGTAHLLVFDQVTLPADVLLGQVNGCGGSGGAQGAGRGRSPCWCPRLGGSYRNPARWPATWCWSRNRGSAGRRKRLGNLPGGTAGLYQGQFGGRTWKR